MTDVTQAPKPATPEDAPTEGFGPIGAKPRPGREVGRYDRPSRPADDFAIDEQRLRRLRTESRS